MATQDDINNFTSSNSVGCFLKLAAQTYVDTTNRSISVATVDDLPDLSGNTIIPGTIFYVESLGVPVIAQVGCWSGLDNRQLRSDFNTNLIYAWGFPTSGRLGDNTTVSKSSPVLVAGGFNDWQAVSGTGSHALGIRSNGIAWAWGAGTSGELGDNTTVDKSSPVSVVGGFTDWCQVSGGGVHSLGIRTNGTAWGWGANTFGNIGDNTGGGKSSPVSVVGGFTDWCQVSAGNAHSLGVRTNGTAWGWGCNTGGGQLGDNTTATKSSPVSVVGGFTDWCQVSASVHSLGVRQNGTAWAWGDGACGRLGDCTTVAKSSPVLVVGGFTDWCQVSAARCHSLGVRQNGTAWAWGLGTDGRLGDNTVAAKSSPVSVVGGFTNWCQVATGCTHSIGVRQNGTVWSWGDNTFGQLGHGTLVARSSPVSVAGGLTGWSQVSAGIVFSTAVRAV